MRSFFVVLLVLSCSLALTNASVLPFNKAVREDSTTVSSSTQTSPSTSTSKPSTASTTSSSSTTKVSTASSSSTSKATASSTTATTSSTSTSKPPTTTASTSTSSTSKPSTTATTSSTTSKPSTASTTASSSSTSKPSTTSTTASSSTSKPSTASTTDSSSTTSKASTPATTASTSKPSSTTVTASTSSTSRSSSSSTGSSSTTSSATSSTSKQSTIPASASSTLNPSTSSGSISSSSGTSESSTTTRSSTSSTNRRTTTTRPPAPIYACTFDSSDCSVKMDTVFSFTKKSQVSTNLIFTDISSITQMTSNGKTCLIPFFDNEIEYYHCKPRNGAAECMTSMGFATCTGAGRFLLAKTNKTNPSFQSKFELTLRNLLNVQNYRLSFYAFMYGSGADTDCHYATDFITVNIQDYYGSLNSAAYRLHDFGPNGQWKKISLDFMEYSGSVTLTVHIGRYSSNKCQVYYGFDQIEIVPTTEPVRPTGAVTNTPTRSTPKNSSQSIAIGLGPVLLLSLILSLLLN